MYHKNCEKQQDQPSPEPKPIKLEAVITCVMYADFLAHTLPINMQHFDNIVVVTAPHDKQTIKVCDHYGVKYHMTDAFRAHWPGTFHKGAGINEGLKQLKMDGWVVHLDADIVLPSNFRKVLENADLDTTMIYGVDRAEFKSFEDWEKFYQNPEPHTQGNGFLIHITHHGKQLGTRIAMQHAGGWIPLGFLQLFHADSGITRYPEGHSDAGREDSVFAMLWPRKKRALIPEVIVYHLESESSPMSVNWKGRVSKPFGLYE